MPDVNLRATIRFEHSACVNCGTPIERLAGTEDLWVEDPSSCHLYCPDSGPDEYKRHRPSAQRWWRGLEAPDA
jgi:hypothetical protein